MNYSGGQKSELSNGIVIIHPANSHSTKGTQHHFPVLKQDLVPCTDYRSKTPILKPDISQTAVIYKVDTFCQYLSMSLKNVNYLA